LSNGRGNAYKYQFSSVGEAKAALRDVFKERISSWEKECKERKIKVLKFVETLI